MTTAACAKGSGRATEATRGPDAYPDKGARVPRALRRAQRRGRRLGDPISVAAGITVGAGLCLIWINLYVEMWPR